jgi:hypothetical protein
MKEYIIVLICNGKHQYQARDDLKAFFGDDSESFVTWYCNSVSCILQSVSLQNHDAFKCLGRLWSFLSKQNVASDDNCSFRDRLDYECENLHDEKNLLPAKAHLRHAHIVRILSYSVHD